MAFGPLRSVFAEFSVAFDTSQLKKGNQAINKGVSALKKLAGAAAVAYSVRRVQSWVDANLNAADEIGKAASKIGVATDFYQQLDFIAQQTGASLNSLGDNVFEVTKRIREAQNGTGEAVDALRMLGLRASSFKGLSPEQTFERLRNAVSNVTDEQTRLFVADKLFGGQAKDTLNVLRLSSAEYTKLKHRAEELGGGMERGVIAKSEKLNSRFGQFRFSMRRVSSNILKVLIPHLEKLADFVSDKVIPKIQEFTEDSGKMKSLFEVLTIAAIAFGFVLGIVFLKVIAITGLIIFLALAIQDLWTAFRGGESTFDKIARKIISWVDKIEEALRMSIINFQEGLADMVQHVPIVGEKLAGFYRSRATQGRDALENRMLGVFDTVPNEASYTTNHTTSQSRSNTLSIGEINLPGVRDVNGFMRELQRIQRNRQASVP